MNEKLFMRFRRKGTTLIRPVQEGEMLSMVAGVVWQDGVLVCDGDKEPAAYVCMDPNNHSDKWAISKKYFDVHYEIDA